MSRKSLWAATKLGLLTNDMLHRKKLRQVKLGAEKHGLAIIASFVLLSGKDGERSLGWDGVLLLAVDSKGDT